jgi:hypothetical protein
MQISDEHYRALGRVTVSYAEFEFFLNVLISELLQLPDGKVAQMVCAQLSLRTQKDLVSSLAKHKLPAPDAEAIRKILLDAEPWITKRNRYAHSYWVSTANLQDVRRFKITATMKGYAPQLEEVSVAELDDVAKQLNEITGRLLDLLPVI